MTTALEVRSVSKNFGALAVTQNVHLSLERGARHALIGPNGAGKTTLINLMTGLLKPDQGSIILAGRDVTSFSQEARVKHGLARTFQINQLFKGLTVIENVALSISERRMHGHDFWSPAWTKSDVLDEAMALLEQLKLESDALVPMQQLPYGRQRLVEIAITLGQQPKVLLLDEPAAGVPSAESHIILDAVDALADDIAILIIEHDMDLVFRFAKSITVLVRGEVLVEGTPDEIAQNAEVKAVYLGEKVNG
ncbi:MAG: ABC transporter ATP-binding protein [Alphaproteobacteria bacterium]|jgi:branched-chain amino acid transport system ATP-binding protein|nr:ABC transporter ATP-binding protein [Alphaproteobacteria bacterium]MBT4964701.1 ABC transporter ATP-binding protein [Alphaproteobacteria bacterium]MBT5161152.1 ABC transporter ATP-binding protein [Alphaproteobacteria bacterium]MBT7746637.1 ABC transporter ATP-binding protein [Alphaproteobacteria bacterium]